jgi:endonuclease-3
MSHPSAEQDLLEGYRLPPEEKIQQVYSVLARFYGDLEWRPRIDPLSELVLTILSQHTSDVNRDRAFEEMRRRFPTWEEVRDAPTEELAHSIRSGGLANIKAPRIQEVLRLIGEERGSLDLDFLYVMPPNEAKAWLSGFRGVGPKTAACVLMFACGMPVLPVDTHVYRVSRRIGLIDMRTNAEKAHDVLEKMLAPEQRYSFHIYLITHGRKVCKAPQPLCEQCVVRDWCSYFNEGRTTEYGRRMT